MRLSALDRLHLMWAWAQSEKSRDPSTRVGAILREANQAVYHSNHNTFMTLRKPEEATREERYADVLHAEEACLLSAGPAAMGATIYCTHEPCGRCWRKLLHMGVARVVFNRTTPDRRERWACQGGRDAAERAGVVIQEVLPT